MTTLLLGAIIAGFTRGLWVEEASGVMTSYSTTTSYSTWILTSRVGGPITSTLVTTMTTTLARQIENDKDNRLKWIMGGPYVYVQGDFPRGKVICAITNLMDVSVVKGVIYVDIAYVGFPLGAEEPVLKIQHFTLEFGEIPAGYTAMVTKSFTPEYYSDPKYPPIAVFYSADITYAGAGVRVVSTSIYTLTLPTETQTRTYIDAYTMTRTYTIEDPLLTGTSMFLLIVIGGVAVVAILFFRKRKTA